MFSQLSAVLFGLASAATWGAGDFSGGLATKRNSTYVVVVVSQLIGLALLLALALLFAEPLPPPDGLLFGALAGLSGGIALAALYQGLAGGHMGVVAPITAVIAAAVPVLFGFFVEGLPSPRQLVGFLIAFLAVWLIARSADGAKIDRRDLSLALIAGLGFGLFFILIDRAGDTAIFWPLAAARLASITLLTITALLLGRWASPGIAQLPLIALAGIMDAAGNAFFILAAQGGRLDIAAILSSFYPAMTVLLAWLILGERLTLPQWFGIILAVVAVILIAV
jgi:drug/metabolite transporter (DMT)-like permease